MYSISEMTEIIELTNIVDRTEPSPFAFVGMAVLASEGTQNDPIFRKGWFMHPGSQLEAVEWRDLVALTPSEKVRELTLGLPWLVLSLWCYAWGWWYAGLVCSFYVFLTGLRQSRNAQHYALGLPRTIQDGVLFVLSAMMLAAMRAVPRTHLHHHRRCLEEEDAEGGTARLPWWRAVLGGPLFFIRLHVSAWRLATRGKRRWI